VGFADQQLVRARTPVVPDGRGFTAPDELRSAQAEALPAAPRVFAGPAVARAVPAFHRQHAEPVADAHTVDIDWLGERRLTSRRQVVVEVERDAAGSQMRA